MFEFDDFPETPLKQQYLIPEIVWLFKYCLFSVQINLLDNKIDSKKFSSNFNLAIFYL